MRLKRRRIRLIIGYIVAVVLLLWVGLTGIERYYDSLLKRQMMAYVQEQQVRLKWMLQAQLKNLQDELLLTALIFARLPEVQGILKGNRLDSDLIRKILSTWATRSDYANIWVQVVSKEGISLYRSWTTKHGDSLLKVRPDLKQVLAHPVPTTTLSLGKYALTVKAIVPVYEGQTFLGVLEVISDMRPLLRSLKQENFLAAVFVESRFASQLSEAGQLTRIGDWVLLQSVEDPVLFGHLRHIDLNALAQRGVLLDFFRNLAWWWVPIKTTAQGEVGALVTTQALNQHKQELVELFEKEKAVWYLVIVLMAFALPLLGVMVVVLNVEHRQLSRAFNSGLAWHLILQNGAAIRINRRLREAVEAAGIEIEAFMSAPLSYLAIVPAEDKMATWLDTLAYLQQHPEQPRQVDLYLGLGAQPQRFWVMMTPLGHNAWLLTLVNYSELCAPASEEKET